MANKYDMFYYKICACIKWGSYFDSMLIDFVVKNEFSLPGTDGFNHFRNLK